MSVESPTWAEQLAVEGLPILEYIAMDVCNCLSQVEGLDVQRPLRDGTNAWGDKSVIVCLSDATKSPEQDDQQTIWDQVFDILCVIAEPKGSAVSLDTRVIEILAQVSAAVAPPNDNEDPAVPMLIRQRGGYAFDTTILYPELFETTDGFYGVMVHVNVNYATAWNDPYTSTTKSLS